MKIFNENLLQGFEIKRLNQIAKEIIKKYNIDDFDIIIDKDLIDCYGKIEVETDGIAYKSKIYLSFPSYKTYGFDFLIEKFLHEIAHLIVYIETGSMKHHKKWKNLFKSLKKSIITDM